MAESSAFYVGYGATSQCGDPLDKGRGFKGQTSKTKCPLPPGVLVFIPLSRKELVPPSRCLPWRITCRNGIGLREGSVAGVTHFWDQGKVAVCSPCTCAGDDPWHPDLHCCPEQPPETTLQPSASEELHDAAQQNLGTCQGATHSL